MSVWCDSSTLVPACLTRRTDCFIWYGRTPVTWRVMNNKTPMSSWLPHSTCCTSIVKVTDLVLLSNVHCGCTGLVAGYWTCSWQGMGSTLTWTTASNRKLVANLLCAQANSAFYLQWDRKSVVVYLAWNMQWRPSVADWGGHMSASCIMGTTVH